MLVERYPDYFIVNLDKVRDHYRMMININNFMILHCIALNCVVLYCKVLLLPVCIYILFCINIFNQSICPKSTISAYLGDSCAKIEITLKKTH